MISPLVRVYVSGIGVGATTLRDRVVISTNSSNSSIDASWTGTVNAGDDTLRLNVAVDETWLQNFIQDFVGSGTVWGQITGTLTDQTDLIDYITALSFAQINTWYGNGRLDSTHGLMLRSAADPTKIFKVTVDVNGNLDTSTAAITP